MTKDEMIEKALAYFKDNEDDFVTAIEVLDSWNGYLGDDRVYNMEDIDEFYKETPPSELMARIYYGYDADSTVSDDKGEAMKHGEFCPNRNYYYYNGYGNLVSTDYKDYSWKLDSWFIESLYDNYAHIYSSLPDGIIEIFEAFDLQEG